MPRAELLAVNTASQRDSVWRDVGWNNFRKHIVTLQRTSNEVPGDPLVHSAVEWQAARRESDNVERALPFDVEQRLADDIAFLAAAEEGPYEISAVALEEQDEPGGLIVRLAANQVIPRGVEDTLRAMFDLLNQCSSRKLARDTCRESLFDLVMTVSQNRIHGRLQSVHWNKPKSRTGAKDREPLSVGLRKVVTGIERQEALNRVDKELLQNSMRHLCDLLERIDRCDKGTLECRRLLREIVKESYEICTSAGTATLEETVKRHGFVKGKLSSTKYIRQVDKIGRYWGMCCSMTEDARKYRTIFASIRLHPLRPYHARSSDIAFTEGRSVRCFVHAEIQILVFYATAPNAAIRKPRVIGVSKSACYLCNLFIRQHARFFITKTHGRLYERWNFPDLKDFDPRARVEFRRVLAAVDGEVRTALVKAGAGLKKREHPMGSWLTLPPPRPLSPVPSTVRSLASNDRAESDRRNVSPSSARELQEASPPTIRPLPTSPLGLVPPPAHTPGPMDQRNGSPAHKSTPPSEPLCTKPAVGSGREPALSPSSTASRELPAHKSTPPPEPLCTKPAVRTGKEPALSPSSTASRELPTLKEFTAAAPIRTRIDRTSVTFETEGAARGSVAIARTMDGKDAMPATSIDIGALDPGEVKRVAREAGRDHVVLHLHQGQGQSTQITLRWL